MSVLLKQIQRELKTHAISKAKAAALKFVPGAKKVYGIRTPVLNEMVKKYKEGGFKLVKELWASGAFEERILAAKMAEKEYYEGEIKNRLLICKSGGKNFSIISS